MPEIVVRKSFGERLETIKEQPLLHPDSPQWFRRDVNEKARAPYDARSSLSGMMRVLTFMLQISPGSQAAHVFHLLRRLFPLPRTDGRELRTVKILPECLS